MNQPPNHSTSTTRCRMINQSVGAITIVGGVIGAVISLLVAHTLVIGFIVGVVLGGMLTGTVSRFGH